MPATQTRPVHRTSDQDTGDQNTGDQDAGDRANLLARHPALAAFAARLGNTPVVCLPRIPGEARIIAKCEWFNPTGSIKDRTAFALICDLLLREPNPIRVLEYSGGNLAVSLSRLCADLGLANTLIMASFMPPAAIAEMRDLGTKVHIVDKALGFWAVMEAAYRMAERHADWSFLHQHVNRANLRIHETGTGAEFARQLQDIDDWGISSVDAFVASIGTGGTLVGVHSALRRIYPQVRMVAVTPAELPYASEAPPNGLPKYAGSGGLGSGRKQPFVADHESRLARKLTVRFPDSLAGIRLLNAQCGLRIGSSAGANWLAARKLARELGPDTVVATVFPSAATPSEWRAANALDKQDIANAAVLDENGEEAAP
ncbi:PLP-dependent cysteine synthase family protein [Stappia sp. ES.058]|uniref:PLP-dependent cysteine synthase family protein n=1 Tax=Stappia sp. ES.058 TaxID=1881061 RepID=UPI00087ADA11|nr:pyridoxal-phosphate dependent enzyme [Stappia sp. ES.058]SDU44214.1 cysteine synthase A [Stappia sp. ES.058]